MKKSCYIWSNENNLKKTVMKWVWIFFQHDSLSIEVFSSKKSMERWLDIHGVKLFDRNQKEIKEIKDWVSGWTSEGEEFRIEQSQIIKP